MTIKEAERIAAEESEFYEQSRIGLLEPRAEGVTTVESLWGRYEAPESRVSPIFDFSDKLGWYMLAGIYGCIGASLMWVYVYYPLLFG